jgi:hypothetical protein
LRFTWLVIVLEDATISRCGRPLPRHRLLDLPMSFLYSLRSAMFSQHHQTTASPSQSSRSPTAKAINTYMTKWQEKKLPESETPSVDCAEADKAQQVVFNVYKDELMLVPTATQI